MSICERAGGSGPGLGVRAQTGEAGRERRGHRHRTLLIGAVGIGLLCALARDSSRTVVERVTIPLARLPKEFDGATVAVIADLHAGPGRRSISTVEELVETVNELRPDVIVLLGDMVHDARDAGRYVSPLAELEAKEAVWACLGNHEHGFVWHSRYLGPAAWPSVDQWRRVYSQVGIGLLVNEARPMVRDGSRLWLVGVDDAYSRHDDLAAALQGADPREFCLAITHSPDSVDAPRIGDVDLVLAAHTHGGQVRLPFLGALYAPCRRPRERAAGLVAANGTTMYVSRGAGEGLPLRLGCPRELTLVTLRTALPR